MNNKFSLDRFIKIQIKIAKKIKIKKCKEPVNIIAGVDVGQKNGLLVGVFSIFSFPEMKTMDTVYAINTVEFPYIPNFLAFRELPVILDAYKKIKIKPDLIFVDGQGLCHPRRCGIASHLGVIVNTPTIGCAKSHLFGNYDIPDSKRGKWMPIKWNNRKIGIVLRTKDNIKPVFVSPGNLVNFSDCIKYTLKTARYRIPEPIRQAHIQARAIIERGLDV